MADSDPGSTSGVADRFDNWVHDVFGVDPRSSERPDPTQVGSLSAPGSTAAASAPGSGPEPGFLDKAKVAIQVTGELTGVSGAMRRAESTASAALAAAEAVGSTIAEHPLEAAAGLGYGVVQGLAPLGVLAPSPDAKSPAFELGRGMGMIAGGAITVAAAGAEEGLGVAADATGIGAVVGVPLNVAGAVTAASGATAVVGGAATIAHAMTIGGDGGGGGTPSISTQAADKQRVTSIKTAFDNTKGHLQESDLNAARRELNGEVVKRKPDGTPWDHVHEVVDAQRGLYRRINDLKTMMSRYPPNSEEYTQMQELLSDMSKALDKSREFVPTGSTSPLNPNIVAP